MAKRRTAKQKAATRKLVAMNKRRRKGTTKGMRRKTARRAFEGLRKRTTRRRKSTSISRRKPRRSMARRSLTKSLTSGSTIKKVALGLGGAAMATAIVGLVAPQFGRVAAPAGAYALGGLEGVIGNFAFDFVRGRMANGTTAQNATPAMEVQ